MHADAAPIEDALNDQPERSALLATRRWSIAGFAGIGMVIQVIVVAQHLPQLTLAQVVSVALATLLVVVGLMRRQGELPWITTAGAALLVAANALPSNGAQWLFINSAALFGAFTLGTVLPRILIVPTALLAGIGVHVAWSANPDGVIATGFQSWDGWIPSIQVMLVCITAHVAWNRLQRGARDLDLQHRQERFQYALEQVRAERGRAWRAAAIRIHESLLNEIRYVLSVPRPDSMRLAEALAAMRPPTAEPITHGMLSRLADDVRANAGHDVDITLSGNEDDPLLSPDSYDALRAALIELLRNRARHDGVTHSEVLLSTREGQVIARVPDARLVADAEAGIGAHTVLTESLLSVGARMTSDATGVTIKVPLHHDPAVTGMALTSAFARGRILISVALGSLAITGALYFAAMITEAHLGARGYLAFALALTGGTLAVLVPLRARSMGTVATILLTLPAILVPLVLSGTMAAQSCIALAQTTASGLNVTGFMVLGIGLWARARALVIPLLAAWLGGVLWYIDGVPADCAQYLLLPVINSLVIIPVTVLVVIGGTRAYGRAEHQREVAHDQQLRQRSAAQAREQVNRYLENLVDRGFEQLQQVVEAGVVDEPLRTHLRCTESLVRVSVQVDPQTAGSFGILAIDLVRQAAEAGHPVDVRALQFSSDDQAVPEDLGTLLHGLFTSPTTAESRLSAFTDGASEYLSITCWSRDHSPTSMDVGTSQWFDDIEVMVDPAEPRRGMAGGVVILAQRKVPMNTLTDGGLEPSGGAHTV